MKKLLTQLNKSYHLFFLFMVFIAGIGLIFLSFPAESRFKYEFQKGTPWQHETLISPFNFAILKTPAEIKTERDSILNSYVPYFSIDTTVSINKINNLSNAIAGLITKNTNDKKINSLNIIPALVQKQYEQGILSKSSNNYPELKDKTEIMFVIGKTAIKVPLSSVSSIKSAYQELNDTIRKIAGAYYTEFEKNINLSDFISENLYYDEQYNKQEKNQLINKLSISKGMVQAGERIIFQGDLIGNNTFIILESLKKAYENKRGNNIEYFLVIMGRIIIISVFMVLMFLYLLYYRRELFDHKRKMIFIILMMVNIVFMAGLSTKINALNIYMVPVAILPILIRIFFDSRTAIFSMLITTLLIGYFAPNSYEYIILQIIAGIIAVFTLNKMHKRSHLVLSAVAVFSSYTLIYFAMSLIQEGSFETINLEPVRWFAISSLLILITYPLIDIFERIFGFVSDVTLIELSNTNHPLLRKLAEEAPGTFQHSLQVANLAEAVIFKIGGNPFLVYAGGLYHDIGKTRKSEFFIENQVAGMNPHDGIDHLKSAEIIIDHVEHGVKLARKYKLPEVLISFITTHHGLTQTNYFYKMYQKENPGVEIDPGKFSYPGPLPQDKETAVLMLTDGIEAATRSLKDKSVEALRKMIDDIVEHKISTNQLINADLTFKEINILKNTLLEKLVNIYHVRIEYPK